jgi:translation elongation factor EF-1beta
MLNEQEYHKYLSGQLKEEELSNLDEGVKETLTKVKNKIKEKLKKGVSIIVKRKEDIALASLVILAVIAVIVTKDKKKPEKAVQDVLKKVKKDPTYIEVNKNLPLHMDKIASVVDGIAGGEYGYIDALQLINKARKGNWSSIYTLARKSAKEEGIEIKLPKEKFLKHKDVLLKVLEDSFSAYKESLNLDPGDSEYYEYSK